MVKLVFQSQWDNWMCSLKCDMWGLKEMEQVSWNWEILGGRDVRADCFSVCFCQCHSFAARQLTSIKFQVIRWCLVRAKMQYFKLIYMASRLWTHVLVGHIMIPSGYGFAYWWLATFASIWMTPRFRNICICEWSTVEEGE